MVLAFSGQDILKSILRDHQHNSSIGEEVRSITAGDNLLLQDPTKTGLARIAIRLHVNVTTDGAASSLSHRGLHAEELSAFEASGCTVPPFADPEIDVRAGGLFRHPDPPLHGEVAHDGKGAVASLGGGPF